MEEYLLPGKEVLQTVILKVIRIRNNIRFTQNFSNLVHNIKVLNIKYRDS